MTDIDWDALGGANVLPPPGNDGDIDDMDIPQGPGPVLDDENTEESEKKNE